VKPFILGSVALVATFAGQAFSADLGGAPPPVAVPVAAPAVIPVAASYGWTGWYVGGNIGYGLTRATWGNNADPTVAWNDPGGVVGFGPFAAGGGFQFRNPKPSGVAGGGQIGYDAQIGNWVLGAVAEFDGLGLKASSTTVTAAASEGLSAQENWLWTLRARAGFVPTPNLLVYLSGGVAYGQVNNALNFQFLPPSTSYIASSTSTKVGWAAGVGIEYKMTTHWSVGLDGLHFDLGTTTVTGLETAAATGLPVGAASLSVTQRFSADLLRGVMNYRF
jgi:outer membrane immunogenic protein